MPQLTYTDLTTIVDFALTPATAEAIMINAIRELNLYLKRVGQELPNLSGTAGSRTVTVDDAEAGAIIKVSKAIYFRDYKGPVQATVGNISYTVQRVEDVVAEVALQLRESTVTRG